MPLDKVPDDDLLRRLSFLLNGSRRVEADLVAHIGEVDARRLFAREASPSMFSYCTHVLRLSEFEAYLRITAARAARQHPVLLAMLREGKLHLTAVARLAPHLTPENRETLLRRASHRTKRELEELIAELNPRPDVPALVRRLPDHRREIELTSFEHGSAQAPSPRSASSLTDPPRAVLPSPPAGSPFAQLGPDRVAPPGLRASLPHCGRCTAASPTACRSRAIGARAIGARAIGARVIGARVIGARAGRRRHGRQGSSSPWNGAASRAPLARSLQDPVHRRLRPARQAGPAQGPDARHGARWRPRRDHRPGRHREARTPRSPKIRPDEGPAPGPSEEERITLVSAHPRRDPKGRLRTGRWAVPLRGHARPTMPRTREAGVPPPTPLRPRRRALSRERHDALSTPQRLPRRARLWPQGHGGTPPLEDPRLRHPPRSRGGASPPALSSGDRPLERGNRTRKSGRRAMGPKSPPRDDRRGHTPRPFGGAAETGPARREDRRPMPMRRANEPGRVCFRLPQALPMSPCEEAGRARATPAPVTTRTIPHPSRPLQLLGPKTVLMLLFPRHLEPKDP